MGVDSGATHPVAPNPKPGGVPATVIPLRPAHDARASVDPAERLILADPSGIPSVDDIIAPMDHSLKPNQAALIRRAYDFAHKAHEGQSRRSGDPYFSHCANVA